jgi:hypothetical protein
MQKMGERDAGKIGTAGKNGLKRSVQVSCEFFMGYGILRVGLLTANSWNSVHIFVASDSFHGGIGTSWWWNECV